jgi:hypothetical protein
MPTTLSWTYEGDKGDMEAERVQRLAPGDVGIHDDKGEVVVIGMDGTNLVCEWFANGEQVRERLTAAGMRAKEMRAAPVQKAATGRPKQPKDGIFHFLGTAV